MGEIKAMSELRSGAVIHNRPSRLKVHPPAQAKKNGTPTKRLIGIVYVLS